MNIKNEVIEKAEALRKRGLSNVEIEKEMYWVILDLIAVQPEVQSEWRRNGFPPQKYYKDIAIADLAMQDFLAAA